jgi:Fe-S-cluster containining protein
VLASIPEVANAAEFINSAFTKEEKAALMSRLENYRNEVAPRFGQLLSWVRNDCPLLVNGECSIYEARPFSCRAMNSIDVNVCEEWKNKPSENISIPSLYLQRVLGQACMDGAKEALQRVNRASYQVDFARCLGMAMRGPGSMEASLTEDTYYIAAPAKPLRPAPQNRKADYPKYKEGEEALGLVHPVDIAYGQYLDEVQEDTPGSMEASKGDHPVYKLWRIRVPGNYPDQESVGYWREHYLRELGEFEKSGFDPREAFDGLVLMQTLTLTYQQQDDKDIMGRIGNLVCNKIAAKALPSLCEPIEAKKRTGKIKIGYISENMSGGSGSEWAVGWAKHQSDEFETYAFNTSLFKDKPGPFHGVVDHFYRMPGPVRDEAKIIKDFGLDVLIHTDIGMTGRNLQFASLRLAPIQCTGWGSPGTTGLPSIDYFLSSELMETEKGDDHYTEKLVRLPGVGICYLPQPMKPSPWGLKEYGLDGGPLILCCQSTYKLLPKWDELYIRINQATNRPILFIGKPTVAGLFPKRLQEAGVRAQFMPLVGFPYYLGLLGQAAVSLDPPGWNGGITTIQALSLRTPVVTLPGEFRRGRQSYAFLKAANAPGLIAKDVEDYIDLVSNEDRRREAAKDMDASGFLEDVSTTRALEEFLCKLIETR